MSEFAVEILIFLPTVLTTGYLMFIATVLQKVMNGLDPATFQRFVPLLVRTATRDFYAVVTGTITFVAVIPYFIVYGFDHLWYTAGVVFFVLSSVAGKLLNLPAYQRIGALDGSDPAQVEEERRRLQTANWVRAFLCLISTVLMTVQFLS